MAMKIAIYAILSQYLTVVVLPYSLISAKSSATSLNQLSKDSLVPSNNDLQALRFEAMSKFVDSVDGIRFAPTSGGVNNVMDYVVMPDTSRISTVLDEDKSPYDYVLRIYNNGLNTRRVEYEHFVLDALAKSSYASRFSFALPTAVRSKDHNTHVSLSNGAEATLFNYIPGVLPKKLCVTEIGRAAGQLAVALAGIHPPEVSPNPCYWDLYRAHHAISRERFYEEMNRLLTQESPHVCKYLTLLLEEIKSIEIFIDKVQAMDPPLPTQLIHGDLHYDNILCQLECDDQSTGGCQVTGLLDFEFCAVDWRCMELAVCLSKYADKPDEALDIFTRFVAGYGEPEGQRLTLREIDLMPELITLRILSNVVYFVGRAVAGEDGFEALTTRAENYFKRLEWIRLHRQEIVDLVAAAVLIVE